MKSILFLNHIKEVQKLELVETCMLFLLLASMQTDQEEILLLVILEKWFIKTNVVKYIKMVNSKLMNQLLIRELLQEHLYTY